MTQASDPPTPSREREALGRVFRRARMMNLLHEALLGAGTYKDLYRIIIASIVWPTALGFSRAVLFRLAPGDGLLLGCGGFGVGSREAHAALRASIGREQDAFDRTILDPASANQGSAREQALFATNEDPVRESFWLKLTHDFDRENILLPRVRRIALPAPAPEGADQLSRMVHGAGRSSIHVTGNAADVLPPELAELLPGESVWTVIRTALGPTLLLGVDRAWDEDQAFEEFNVIQLEWFATQAAMALEKIDLLAELRRSNENMKILDQLKSTFLSTISHELRTPLTGIMGFTKLLIGERLGPVPENQREVLSRVRTSAEKLKDLINDLIELAEIDAGMAAQVNLEAVDPLDLLIETLPRLNVRRRARHVTISPVIGGVIPMIRADRRRLARVLYHLLDNAVKFSPPQGDVEVRFEVGPAELQIHVMDHGIGIEPELLDRIFEAFYQIDHKLQRIYPGLGIGLAVSTKLVAGTGGHLKAKSHIGEGSTFTIIYPIA